MLVALALWISGQEAPPSPFDWLVGRWCTEPKGETRSCESWTPMDAGVMHGEGTTRTARATRREAMRITVNQSGAFFHAEPDGQAPTDFRAATVDPAARAARSRTGRTIIPSASATGARGNC